MAGTRVLPGMLAALLLAAPASASPARTPPVPVVTQGFAATGPAGSQAVVRLTRAVTPVFSGWDTRIGRLHASSGSVGGWALVPVKGGKDIAYAVEVSTRWACGNASCTSTPDHRSAWANGYALPAGDYVLVLLGARGARVDVSLSFTEGARPVRVPLTAHAQPSVEPTVDEVVTPVAEGVAWGTHARRATAERAVLGVVHAADTVLSRGMRWDVAAGPGDGCSRGATRDGTRTPDALGSVAVHAVMTTVGNVGPVCSRWRAVAPAAMSQKGVGIYVPVVLP